MELNKPSITRLARKAGIKCVSEECYPELQNLIIQELDRLIYHAIVVNSESGTKILMPDDIYKTISLFGKNMTKSTFLGKKVQN